MLDDNTAHNLDSATSTGVAEPHAASPEGSTPDHNAQNPAAENHEEVKAATPTSSEDFASALHYVSHVCRTKSWDDEQR